MALSDDLAVSAWLSSTCSLGGASAPPIIFFSPSPRPGSRGHEPSPPGFKRSGSSAAVAAPQGMRRRQRPAGGFGDETPGPALCDRLCEPLVTHGSPLDGLLGMRKSSDPMAAGAGQQEREENRWIKSGSRIDLEGMSRSLRARRGALAGALKACAGLRENRRMARSPLTYRPSAMPSRGKPRASQKRKSAFVDQGVVRRYPDSMKPGIRSANHASLTSPGTSAGPSGGTSAGPSQSDRGEAAQSPITARLAGLCACRHLRGHLEVSPFHRLDLPSRTPCTRRLRYRLRAGYATLLLRTARRPWRAQQLLAGLESTQVDGEPAHT